MSFKQSKTIKAQIYNLLEEEYRERTPRRFQKNYLQVLAHLWYRQAVNKISLISPISPLHQFLNLLVSGELENPETIRRCWQEVRAENPHFLEPKEAKRRAEKARKTKEYYSML